jgi:3-deoxy-7-phosphoheptulonate synthase
MGRSPWADKFAETADRIGERSTSWKRAGSIPKPCRRSSGTDFYTSHEALLLPYEQALTRQDSLTGDWYDTSRALPVDRRPHPFRRARRISSSCAASAIRSG